MKVESKIIQIIAAEPGWKLLCEHSGDLSEQEVVAWGLKEQEHGWYQEVVPMIRSGDGPVLHDGSVDSSAVVLMSPRQGPQFLEAWREKVKKEWTAAEQLRLARATR